MKLSKAQREVLRALRDGDMLVREKRSFRVWLADADRPVRYATHVILLGNALISFNYDDGKRISFLITEAGRKALDDND